jgi:outer membrane protein, heavy metal efflux system
MLPAHATAQAGRVLTIVMAALAGAAALCAPPATASSSGPAPASYMQLEPAFRAGDGLDALLRHALRHSPTLEADYQRWRAAVQRVPQARALPEPQLSLGLLIDEVDRSADYMGERYALSQAFPWFGKLALRGDIALAEAEAEARRFEATRLALVERVTTAWFEYAWLQQAVETAHENRELLLRLESVARARYRVGETSQADVNRAQVELGRMDEQLRSLQDRLGPAAAGLNAVLGRRGDAPLPGPLAPSRQPLALLPERADADWLALARAHNPWLAAGRHEAEREAHGIELARREYYPDFMIGVEYERNGSARMARMDGGGSDMVTGMVSFSIPIRRARYDAGLAEARARHVSATRALAGRELTLEAELAAALFDYRDSHRKLELYGATLLPKARQLLATTESAYRTGEASFAELIDAQRALLEFSLAYERAAADRATAIARINALVGESPVPNEGDRRS